MARICLNMIVKNEAAIILRALAAVAPYINSYMILDTGSTDGTPDIIRAFFREHGILGHVRAGSFENFSQARNDALDLAYARDDWDYLLFCDADMELVVEDRDWISKLDAPSYIVAQRSGGMVYWNVRLVHRGANARYHGVTHEYCSVEGSKHLDGIWYNDHACGSNRKDKFDRDIKLLEGVLAKQPDDARSVFYLASTHRDAGHHSEAACLFHRRAKMHAWEEEGWYAELQDAICQKRMGHHNGFVTTAIAAHNRRPWRAEALYELAKHYREQNQHNAGLVFVKSGLEISYPPKDDMLFVDEYAHRWGLPIEFSILAYYGDQDTKQHGYDMTNKLLLDPECPQHVKEHAKQNMFWYLPTLKTLCPSYKDVKWPSPNLDGWNALNPCIATVNGGLVAVIRTVNYIIHQDGSYDMQGDTAIRTRNFYVQIKPISLEPVLHPTEINWRRPRELYPHVIGLEDMRITQVGHRVMFNACVREQNADGWCEQVVGEIDPVTGTVTNWSTATPEGPKTTEKNWAPFAMDGRLQFMYRPGHVVGDWGQPIAKVPSDRDVSSFSGGSPLVPMDGGWLAVVHEVYVRPDSGHRHYVHRFVWYAHDYTPKLISPPFTFHERVPVRGYEYAAGLTFHPYNGDVLVSFSIDDKEAWCASLSRDEVRSILR